MGLGENTDEHRLAQTNTDGNGWERVGDLRSGPLRGQETRAEGAESMESILEQISGDYTGNHRRQNYPDSHQHYSGSNSQATARDPAQQ